MLYFVYGNQGSEIKKVVKLIAKQHLSSRDDMNFIRYDGNNVLVQDAVDDANSVPLGYDYKVVSLENCYFLQKPKPRNKIESEQDYQALINYINNPNPDCDLILSVPTSALDTSSVIYKLLKENAQIKEIQDPDVKEWGKHVKETVFKYFEKYPHCKMDMDALNELSARTTGDIPLLRNSIIKLFLYKEHVTYDDVVLMVAKPLEENTFALFNYLLDNKNYQALGLFRDLRVNNVEPITLISMLANQFRLFNQVTYLARNNRSNDEIAKELKMNPKRVEIFKRKMFYLSNKRVNEVLEQLFQLDYKIKSGLVDRFYAFELFLINFKRD